MIAINIPGLLSVNHDVQGNSAKGSWMALELSTIRVANKLESSTNLILFKFFSRMP